MWPFVQMLLWGFIWLITWPTIAIWRKIARKPRLDNCLTWAIRRWSEEGGYIAIRWCRVNMIPWLRWPHFLWLPPDKHTDLKHFVPLDFDQNYHMFPKAFFEGKVVTGDEEESHLEN